MSEQETKSEQVSRVCQMALDNGQTWDLSDNDKAALEAITTDRAALLSALKGIMADIDAGLLVRNTDADSESGWAIKMLGFVGRLKAAQTAIENADGGIANPSRSHARAAS